MQCFSWLRAYDTLSFLHFYLELTVGRFLCANNKPFAFKELLIHIQRTSFNSVLKQSF
jgi:hypothetical protein